MRLLPPLLLATPLLAAAAPHPLLHELLEKWSGDRQRWAFTQHVRETDTQGRAAERVERYDPARGPSRRWALVSLDGRRPTPEEAAQWNERKNRRPPRQPKPLTDYVNVDEARVIAEDADRVSFQLPLRSTVSRLVPEERINLVVTVDKRTRELERAQVSIDGPFSVALGLARIIELEFDLQAPPGGVDAVGGPEPQGRATAVINRLGRRVEYTWNDFERPGAPRE